jgi:hypothetical protein
MLQGRDRRDVIVGDGMVPQAGFMAAGLRCELGCRMRARDQKPGICAENRIRRALMGRKSCHTNTLGADATQS